MVQKTNKDAKLLLVSDTLNRCLKQLSCACITDDIKVSIRIIDKLRIKELKK